MANIQPHAINWKNDKVKGASDKPIYGCVRQTLYSIPYRNTAYMPATLFAAGQYARKFDATPQAIREEANRKRSKAAKGNDNAAKDREKTVVDQSVQPLSKEAKDRVAKAAASKTHQSAVTSKTTIP